MSIASELSTLAANKAAIKAAITAKSPVTAPTDALSQWPTSIASIPSGPVQQGWIYGYVIDESDPNPATRVSYIEDNAEFDPLYMDFANDSLVWGDWQDFVEEYFKPAMLKSDGTIDYYLDPNDLTKKADGVTASDVANTSYDGNAMLIVKPIYYNISAVGSKIMVRFSNYKQDDTWYNWTHLKSDGTYAEFCGWSLFTGSVVSSKLRSIATGAVPQGNNNAANDYAYATANGANWYPTTWADEMMWRLLFPLLCKSTDSQGVIGGGAAGYEGLRLACGALADKGYFWGKANVTSTVNYGCKFLGMENLWGERWRRVFGICLINGNLYVKLTPSTIDGSSGQGFQTSNIQSDYTSNYILSGPACPMGISPSCISRLSPNAMSAFAPIAGSGSSYAVNYCDFMQTKSSGIAEFEVSGGTDATGVTSGIFATNLYPDQTSIWVELGTSLSYHFF